MSVTEWVSLLEVVAWPVVAVVALVFLRSQLPSLVGRLRKVGAFGVEFELHAAAEFRPAWTDPHLGDMRGAVAAEAFSSGAMSLMQQIGGEHEYDYATVDLGEGQRWLTSRLYIFSIMLQRMRGLRCWVFVRQDEGTRRVYLGLASPEDVRWSLARRYPWLESAYAGARAANESDVTSGRGAIAPLPATQLVRGFLETIQSSTPPPPEKMSEWIQLSVDGPWERAGWLDPTTIAAVLGEAVKSSAVSGDWSAPNSELTNAVLATPGTFVALVGHDWIFNGVIDRGALLEEMSATLARRRDG